MSERNGMRKIDMIRTAAVALLATGIVMACSNPFEPKPAVETQQGKGSLRILIAGQGAKSLTTILPAAISSASSYSISLTGGPSADVTIPNANLSTPISLALGSWSLVVEAFDASANKIGASDPTPITIGTGLNTINVNIKPLRSSGGTGRLTVNFSWPAADVTGAVFSLRPWSSASPSQSDVNTTPALTGDITNGTIVVDVTNLASGTYMLVAKLSKAGAQHAPISVIAQIYDNLTSSATIAISSADLSQPPAAPSGLAVQSRPSGDIRFQWTDSSTTASGLKFFDGTTWQPLPIDTTIYDVPAASILASSTTYKICTTNAFGDSAASTYTFVPCRVTYSANGGTGTVPTDPFIYESGKSPQLVFPTASALSNSGYFFAGWSNEGGASLYQPNSSYTLISNQTFSAQWSTNPTVTFSYPDGTQISSVLVTYNTPVTQPADPVRAGYTFGGWYQEAACTNSWVFATPITANTSIYAKWTAIQYGIAYNLNGGTNGANPANYTVATATITLVPATQTGYTFGGWYSDTGFTTLVTQIPLGSTGAVTIYAKWTAIQYGITYNLNSGTNGANPANYTVSTATISLVPATQTGYTFGGWYSDSGFTTSVTQIPLGSTGAVTLYAKWTAIQYGIIYNLNGGTNNGANPATYTVATPTITLAPATQTDYTFGGWYSDSSFTTPVTQISLGSTGAVTVYAQWTGIGSVAISFTISSDLTQSLGFSPASATITSPATATIQTSNPTLFASGSGWRWSVDGNVITAATTSIFIFDPTVYGLGQHNVSLSVLYNGLNYSGDIMVTVQ